MNKKNLNKIIQFVFGAGLGLLPLSSTLKADFIRIDDFENASLGSVNEDPASPWIGHSNSGLVQVLEEFDNKYLGVSWTGGFRTGSLPLTGGQSIAPGEVVTFFLQFRAPPLTPNSNEAAHFGLGHAVDTSSNAPFEGFRPEVRLRPGPSSEWHSMDVRDGGAWRTVTAVRRDLWHSVWFVIDRTGGDDSYQVYLNDSAGPAQPGDLLGYEAGGVTVSNFSFRSGGSAADILDSFVAIAHAATNVGLHLDNLWLDKSGENLAFAGQDLDAWQSDFTPFSGDFALNFGTGADSGEALLIRPPQNFALQWDNLEYRATEDGLVSSAAIAKVEGILPRQDFTLNASMTLAQLNNVGSQRVGLVVLASHIAREAPFTPSSNDSFYGLVWLPAEPGNPTPSRIQIRRGFSGAVLAEETWNGLHPSIANLGIGGIGQVYQLEAAGTYDESGMLNLAFTLTDSNNFSQTVSASIIGHLQGNWFGMGGRISNMEADNLIEPRFNFHSLSMNLGDEPGPITDPIASMPFSYDFGSAAGRDADVLLRQNRPDDWSLQPEALRLTTADSAYHRSLSSLWVIDHDPSRPFTASATATLENLADAPSDYRIGLVLLGDADREIFDASDDSYHTLQLIPNAATGASLAVRRGMNGTVLSEINFSELTDPPATVPGSTYVFEFTGVQGREGQLLFVARVTDQHGARAEILGEIADPIPGNRFGFGAWHRAGDNGILDVSSFSLTDGVGLRRSALYTDNDVVLGLSENDSWLAYNRGSGNGQVGSGGGAGNRRHQNPVLGFQLPDVPLDNIQKFELRIHHRDRSENGAHLYGLLPEDPSTYTDGTITPDADGIDVWYQGADLDDREGLIGAAWADFIPAGASPGAFYSVDVTDFIKTFYDEDGPTREKVYFRLSPSTTWTASILRRIEVETGPAHLNAPTLNYIVFPPLDDEPPGPPATFWVFGNDPDRDGDGGFARMSQRGPGWTVTGDALNHTTDATGNWNIYSATTPLTTLSAGENFTLSMTATMQEVGGTSTFKRFGIALLGEVAGGAFDPATDRFLGAVFFPELGDGNGQLRIIDRFDGSERGRLTRSSGSVANGTEYLFTVKGTYTPDGDLTLEFSVTDGAVEAPQVLTRTIAAADVPTGGIFGFGGRQMVNASVDFNSFGLVPDSPAELTFASWQQEVFTPDQLNDPGISGPFAAPAGDGVANLIKYAMDLDPMVPVAGRDLFISETILGELVFSYWERTDVTDIDYIVEVSTGLDVWNSGPGHVAELSRTPVRDNLEEVTVHALLPDGAARGFMRLRIQQK